MTSLHPPESQMTTNTNSKSLPNLQQLEQLSLRANNKQSPPASERTSSSISTYTPPPSSAHTHNHSTYASPTTVDRNGAVRSSPTPDVVNRPSFLPPKSSVELQKHMKEYEDIAKQIKKSSKCLCVAVMFTMEVT
jgi:hypothetical protein